MSAGKVLGLVLSLLLIAIGALWTLQGLGYLHGSPMTGQKSWSLIGPAVAGLGVALAIVVVGKRR